MKWLVTSVFVVLCMMFMAIPVLGYAVRTEHPRLYVDSSTAAEVSNRAANGNSAMYSDIMTSSVRQGVEREYATDLSSMGQRALENYIARSAFVVTVGEVSGYSYVHTMEQYRQRGKDALMEWANNREHDELSLPFVVVGYDHFYHDLTPAERKIVVDAIIVAADSCISEQGKTYTRFGSKAPGLSRWVMAGLGFYGDGANIGDGSQAEYYNNKAKEYCDDYEVYFKNGTMAVHNWLEGMWFSPDYANYMTRLVWVMEAWNTATTDTDTYNDFTDWYRGVPNYFLHSSAPYNKDIVRFGDVRFAHTGFDDQETLQEDLAIVLNAIRYRADIDGDFETANIANWMIRDNNMDMYSSTWHFLWNAPDASHDSPASTNTEKYYAFMNEGLYFSRSSWSDPDATYVGFTSHNYYLSNHQSADAGSFIIYKRDPLAIRSGSYGSGDKKSHGRNYQYRTIAHNSILVYDPAETWYWSGAVGGGKNSANDGGQKWFNDAPYDVSDLTPGSKWDAGGFDRISMSDDYDYILTDITKAYTDKVSLVQRELLYLKDIDDIIVFDRLHKDADKYSMITLHSKLLPVVSGDEYVISSNGGYLNGKIVFPVFANMTILGGESHRFEDLEGNNYPMDTVWTPVWDDEYGNYRINVRQPSDSSVEYYFNVMHPTLTEADKPTVFAIEGVGIHGADIGRTAVIFRDGVSSVNNITYTTTASKHYVAGNKPGDLLTITADSMLVDGSPFVVPESGVITFVTSDENKVIDIISSSYGGNYSVEICDNGADDDFDGLIDCDDLDCLSNVFCQGCVPVHDADLEPCDGVVSLSELIAYIDSWKTSDISLDNVMEAVSLWREARD